MQTLSSLKDLEQAFNDFSAVKDAGGLSYFAREVIAEARRLGLDNFSGDETHPDYSIRVANSLGLVIERRVGFSEEMNRQSLLAVSGMTISDQDYFHVYSTARINFLLRLTELVLALGKYCKAQNQEIQSSLDSE